MGTFIIRKNGADACTVLPYTNSSGSDIARDQYLEYGGGVAIAQDAIAVAATGPVKKGPGFRAEVDKVSAQAWTAGEKIYLDAGNQLFTTVSTDNTLAGVAAAAAANPSSTGIVEFAALPGA